MPMRAYAAWAFLFGRVCVPFTQQPIGLTLPSGTFDAAGETCKEALLHKPSESTAHISGAGSPLTAGGLSRASAGIGFHSEGRSPPNLPEEFFDSLT